MLSILKTQKKEIYAALKEWQIEPKVFDVIEEDRKFALRYKDLSFAFYSVEDSHEFFSLSYTRFTRTFQSVDTDNQVYVDSAMKTFKSWIAHDLRPYMIEEKAEDPFKLISESYSTPDTETDSFTKDEIKQIEQGLDNFSSYAKETLKLEESKLDTILKELRDLKSELTTQPKRKWLRNFKGFLLQEIWDIIKDESERKLALEYFRNLFETVKENLPRLLE